MKIAGIMSIILSLIVLYFYLETSSFIILLASAAIGIAGIILLHHSGGVRDEGAILSILMVAIGLITPLFPLPEEYSIPVTIIAYAVALILLVWKPSEKPETPVKQ